MDMKKEWRFDMGKIDPQKKAKELVINFSGSTDVITPNKRSIENAKKCVNEIIKALYELPSVGDIVDARQAGGYWEQVKYEIECL